MLPAAGEGKKHNCVSVLNEACSPHAVLSETPIAFKPDFVIIVDCSLSRHPATGQNPVSYAVFTQYGVFKSGSLPSLCKPCTLLSWLPSLNHENWLKLKQRQHHYKVASLLDPVLLSKAVAVWQAHTSNPNPVSTGRM